MKAREWDEFKEANPRLADSFSGIVNFAPNCSAGGRGILSTGVKHLLCLVCTILEILRCFLKIVCKFEHI